MFPLQECIAQRGMLIMATETMTMAEAQKTGFIEDSLPAQRLSFEQQSNAATTQLAEGELPPEDQEAESGGNRSERSLRKTGYFKTPGGTRYWRAGPGVVAVILKVTAGTRRLPGKNAQGEDLKPWDYELCYLHGDARNVKTWDEKTLFAVERVYQNKDRSTGRPIEGSLGSYDANLSVSYSDNKNKQGPTDVDGFVYLRPKAPQAQTNAAPAATIAAQPMAAAPAQQAAATTVDAEVLALRDLFEQHLITAVHFKAEMARLRGVANTASTPIAAVKAEAPTMF